MIGYGFPGMWLSRIYKAVYEDGFNDGWDAAVRVVRRVS